jgi:hypothetical protein
LRHGACARARWRRRGWFVQMVWATAAWIGGGYVGNVVREEAAGGRAALAVSCVVGGAGEARLAVLGFFSIQEKAIFNTRYHYISSHITLLSLCIIVYHCRLHDISCPSKAHDINDIDDT